MRWYRDAQTQAGDQYAPNLLVTIKTDRRRRARTTGRAVMRRKRRFVSIRPLLWPAGDNPYYDWSSHPFPPALWVPENQIEVVTEPTTEPGKEAAIKTAHGLSGLPMGDGSMGTMGYSRVYDLTIDYLKTFGMRVVEAGPHLAIMEPREGAIPEHRLRISWGRPDPGGDGITIRGFTRPRRPTS